MKLFVELKNCYGISEMSHEFDFTKNNAYSVYAPNGFMKTSFAKTFDDLAKGLETKDRIFEERKSIRTIRNESQRDIDAESVFVIEPFNADYKSDNTPLLLVNDSARKKYEKAFITINDKQKSLIKKLDELSGYSRGASEEEILRCFDEPGLSQLAESLEKQIIDKEITSLSEIKYTKLFNDKTLKLFESGVLEEQIEDYVNTYRNLISKSDVLSQPFNHDNAYSVSKQLDSNGFFAAEHTVRLKTKQGHEEFSSRKQLEDKIAEETKKILTNPELVNKFNALNGQISNKELREFRQYLSNNQFVVPLLKDYKCLQKSLWLQYLINQKELYASFLEAYRVSKKEIEDAITIATTEKTEWEGVVEQFNARFSVPFTVRVENQHDVILNKKEPTLEFRFFDCDGEKTVTKTSLMNVLSQGEKRAFYILNILFELETRKKRKEKTILIVDDIADSFDYKNKYAIIEYLKDIAETGHFKCVFLSHNFDFYRSISGRLGLNRNNRLCAVKDGRKVSLHSEKYQNNPFIFWKKHLDNEAVFYIASIPFVRNLAEYCGFTEEYNKLTSLLHIKDNSQSLTVENLCEIFKKVLHDQRNLKLPGDQQSSVLQIIFELADTIADKEDESIQLEGKIILSIAIRLLAEIHMIKEIRKLEPLGEITRNQSVELLKTYQRLKSEDREKISLLKQVTLMTPENIHLNSFMYEPILDMDIGHLRQLYGKVKKLPR